MGAAALPCSNASDCCGKESQEIQAFPAKDPGVGVPGLRLDLPLAVDHARTAGDDDSGSAEDGQEAQAGGRVWDGGFEPARYPPLAEQPYEAEDAGGGSRSVLPPPTSADDDRKSEDLFAPPPATPRSNDGQPWTAAEKADEPASVPPKSARPSLASSPSPLEPPPTPRPQAMEMEALAAGEGPPGQSPNSQTAGLVLGFELPDGSLRTVDFTGRLPPMGLDFIKASPIPVHHVKPGGHAHELGIEAGWLVKTINGQDVEWAPFGQAMQMLAAATARAARQNGQDPAAMPTALGQWLPAEPSPPAPLSARSTRTPDLPPEPPRPLTPPPAPRPSGGLQITFLLPDGSRRDVDFGSRAPPLGMDFEKAVPITVRTVRQGGHSDELGISPGWQVSHVAGRSVEGMSAMEVFHMMQMATRSVK